MSLQFLFRKVFRKFYFVFTSEKMVSVKWISITEIYHHIFFDVKNFEFPVLLMWHHASGPSGRVSPKVSPRISARLLVRLSARLFARLFALARRFPRVSDQIICMALCKTLSDTRFFTRVSGYVYLYSTLKLASTLYLHLACTNTRAVRS